MSAMTGRAHPAPLDGSAARHTLAGGSPPGYASQNRRLPPRASGNRPQPGFPPVPGPRALELRRAAANRAARARPGPLHIVLYALTGPDGTANGDLAAARGYAERQRLVVTGPPLVDTLDSIDIRTGGDAPLLRRGYARALQMLADPACPVRGVVAVSRTAITPVDRLYQDQLSWYADRRAGLWLVRGETAI
ncbi:hypothetical protein ABZ501_27265 [Streptomyces sp. NPDC019922]|uniref:hypothetical protein n=1 Tax=Streptomyces TaxID=1883 RepID=UPI001371C574|nr:hypothetical protein [Streptomyces sp. SID7834]MYT58971.1 hypothetical protein [Streptomyces sp. SID7834]